ncbi:hypothetical protein PAXRUDRAFT_836363 [Paxillus rubicundulus Ve08.2h10]|uniref:Uncharacterized protein n=1 Tax=Paxillus rubicundulus Ve08.2h10 TaxID=930991 RepID=A0A0D0CPX3_9AGAM|nr:hypothetical protein PAXRUDRAFT_836363 [Paxillus rubicundulus Ve08.2h10]
MVRQVGQWRMTQLKSYDLGRVWLKLWNRSGPTAGLAAATHVHAHTGCTAKRT